MAQQSSLYNTDGATKTFPSSKHIASISHVAVYFKSVATNLWSIVEQSEYDLVNNSVVFNTIPDNTLYSSIEIRVADTTAELIEAPSDIAIVAGSIANVNTVAGAITSVETVSSNIGAVTSVSGSITNVNAVATDLLNINAVAVDLTNINTVSTNIANVNSVATTIVPNIAEILQADTNAATATTQAGVATTQAGIATTKAGEASASATLAAGYAASINPSTLIQTQTHAATSKTTPVDADELPIVDSEGTFGLKKVTWSNIKATHKTYTDTLYVALSGNQTIAGTKTFSSSPLFPTPTAGDNSTKGATTAFIQSEITGKPAFSATRTTSQTVSTGVATKVQFATEEFDTTNAYDNATNYRFQPTKAGYYQVNLHIEASATTSISSWFALIYKNGVAVKSDYNTGSVGSSASADAKVSALIYLNGSTDYIEGYAQISGAGTITLSGNGALNFFQAFYVLGA